MIEAIVLKFALTVTLLLVVCLVLGRMADTPSLKHKAAEVFHAVTGALLLATPISWVIYFLVLIWS